MMEVEIDKSEPEGNGYATGGKINFGNRKSIIPFKATTVSATNTLELNLLNEENLHSPKEFFVFIRDNEAVTKLFGKHDKALENRQAYADKIDKNLGKITERNDFNYVYMYFRDPVFKIDEEMAKNIFDILDSQYNHMLVLPLPPFIDNIESVKNLIDVFKNRKSYFGMERPIMGTIPHGINGNMMEKLIDEYHKNGINLFGFDFNGGRPKRLIIQFIKDKIIKRLGSNYFLEGLNLAKGHYLRYDIRPINDLLTLLCGVDSFNNQRFPPRFMPRWSDLSPKVQQRRIDNVRFRILDTYGEYNRFGLEESSFNFDKQNETSILNKTNYDSIYDTNTTKEEFWNLYQNSRLHNWILTHKEINTTIRKEIENHNLVNYFQEKQYVVNDVNDFLSNLKE